MDIANYTTKEMSLEGVEMPLIDVKTGDQIAYTSEDMKEDDEPRKMFLKLLGPTHPDTQREQAKIRNRANKRPDNYVPSDADLEKEAELDSMALSRLTVGGLVFFREQWVELTKENSYKVYRASEIVRNQAFNFLFDAGNFVKGKS